MELKRSNLLFYLSAVWALLIFAIGFWWLYLISKLGKTLEELQQFAPPGSWRPNFNSIIIWEGLSFVVLLILCTVAFLILYNRDRKKSLGLQRFYAGLTHELKTPLASIQLQTEVLKDKLENQSKDNLEVLVERLLEDTNKLENELDKLLHLSRVETGEQLKLTNLDLNEFINKNLTQHNIQFKNNIPKQTIVHADDYALKVIFRNLIENSIQHSQLEKNQIVIHLDITEENDFICLRVKDNGKGSILSQNKLGKIFSKSKDSRGSGIGLYLVSRLVKAMNGKINFKSSKGFSVTIFLRRGHE